MLQGRVIQTLFQDFSECFRLAIEARGLIRKFSFLENQHPRKILTIFKSCHETLQGNDR